MLAGAAVAAVLVGCGEPPPTDIAPEAVAKAFVDGSGCRVSDPTASSIVAGTLLAEFGPKGAGAPNPYLDRSFLCRSEAAGSPVFGAVRYGDAPKAAESAEWFRGGSPCHPVGSAAQWMLMAARPAGGPQASDELEDVVAGLGGRMVATCR